MYEKESQELLEIYQKQLNELKGFQSRYLLARKYLRYYLIEYKIQEAEFFIEQRIKYNIPNEEDVKILKRFKGEK